ncbi:bifunctional UDP-sugar hydrolase/5'-nucleotidase [Maridesulfovibrio sp.]|uniref:bifunctional metallophosphatase/5'-nucleotidase n=1 Tax=Maridesulfovibrio sp. TaxID=2795000 RepID=UPI002A186DFF|nr:bifunctional UDP-sugar hydrolase/5'-nucleotidase [Maridesulfovibrio sp.]
MRFFPIIAAIIAILATSSPGLANRWDLVILTTSGLNGQLLPAEEKNEQHSTGMVRTFGGFARIQSVFESYRAQYPGATITVATGDDLMGESLTNEKGTTVFEAMNKMGFNISTLGNHEFNRGTKFLANCLKSKKFPTVCSNLNITQGNPLRNYITSTAIFERNFIKVGFMGMILPELKLISNPGSGISIPADYIKSARKTAHDLKRNQKADIIVLLSHLPIEAQKKILQEVPEIDIVCGGQSYKDIFPGQEIIARDASTPGLMVQCGSQGRYVGVLKINMNARAINKHEWTIIPVTDNTQEDSRIKAFLSSRVKDTTSVPVAISPVALDTRAESIRTGETIAGGLVSSIMREKFNTDIAFQNGGGFRGNKIIPAGPITDQDINTMFPFGNKMIVIKVSGKTLKQILERSVHKLPASSGAFLQISGLKFTLDIKGQPQELEIDSTGKPAKIKTAGSRVSNIKIMDKSGSYKSINDTRKYSIATNSYLARGGDGYIMLKDVPEKVETFVKVNEVIKSGMLKMETLETEFPPVIYTPDGSPYKN